MISLTWIGRLPSSIRLTNSLSWRMRAQSAPTEIKSLRCCGVTPSGPAAEPGGNEEMAWTIDRSEICKGANRSESFGSKIGFLSDGAGGCFAFSPANVSGVSGAGSSSQQIRRMAPLKLPSSSLLATADARYFAESSFIKPLRRTGIGCFSSQSVWQAGHFERQFVILDRIMLVSLRFAPPLFGLARMFPPKLRRFDHRSVSSGSLTTASMSSPKRAEHDALADRGILLTSAPLATGCDRVVTGGTSWCCTSESGCVKVDV